MHCRAVGPRVVYDYCQDCWAKLHQRTEDNFEYTYEHWWNNGVCERCGASNECSHDSGTVDASEWYEITERKDNHNGTHHHTKGIWHYILRCAECGQYIEENYEKKIKDNFFIFFGVYNNGMLFFCYSISCT